MKSCPQCHRAFTDGEFCPIDGAPLHQMIDPLLGVTLLGQFSIEELIGQGAMGRVYLAQQHDINRKVAAKVLKKKLAANREDLLRFKREAAAVAKLNHHNIVKVHVAGETPDENLPFMILEYVEGPSLEQVCRIQGALPPLRVLTLSRQIASALVEAHAQHVLHRDLKPDNIKILREGMPNEQIKILDFGIAKIMHSDKEYANLTATGVIFATPAYCSPEQAEGQPLDFRTDLYSLGIIMYRLATGFLPFRERPNRTLFVQQINDTPRSPLELNPELPISLELIIMKLLQKDRALRYESAQALLDSIDAAIREFAGEEVYETERRRFTQRALVTPLDLTGLPHGAEPSSTLGGADSYPSGRRRYLFPMVMGTLLVAALSLAFAATKLRHGSAPKESPGATQDSSKASAKSTERGSSSMKLSQTSHKQGVPPKPATMAMTKRIAAPGVASPGCELTIQHPGKYQTVCGNHRIFVRLDRKRRSRKLRLRLFAHAKLLEGVTLAPIDKAQGVRVVPVKLRRPKGRERRFVISPAKKGGTKLVLTPKRRTSPPLHLIITLPTQRIRRHKTKKQPPPLPSMLDVINPFKNPFKKSKRNPWD